MTATQTFTLDHPQLGSLTGRLVNRLHPDGQSVTEPVVHFRSIPYATIPARFKQSVLLDHLPAKFDARPRGDYTQYGAACPQVPQPTGRGSATGGFVPGESPITYDEETCLNLTISVPARHLSNQGGLSRARHFPVMVYVHGGGFVEGKGHVSALHDTTKMTELAAREDKDVLVVSIGYRLNWQGFIACHDLLEEARENGEPAFLYGLRDQRNGFDWIKRHIAGFGGDPSNITAFGESAGAVSLYMHACSDVPLFNRVILQSGSPNAIDSWTLGQSDARYHRLLSYLGVSGATREERLQAIREVPISRLVDFIRENNVTTMNLFLGPESGFFLEQPFWSKQGDILANCPWIDEIMIGDDSGEGLGFAPLFKDVSADSFVAHVRTALGDDPAQRILEAYEIHDGMDEGLFWQNALTLVGDLIFSEPTHSTATAIARAGRQRLYRWHFCLPNPFPGSIFSYAMGHHFVELMYQFMTLTARLPTHRNYFLRRQAEQMACCWVWFANGIPPMPLAKPYCLVNGSIMICDMWNGWCVRTKAEDELLSQADPWGPRRYRQWEILNEEIKRAGRARNGSGLQSQHEKIQLTRNQLLMFDAPGLHGKQL